MNHQAIQMTGARAGIGCATALAAALEGCNHDISVRDRQTAAAYEAASFSPGQVPAAGGGTSAA